MNSDMSGSFNNRLAHAQSTPAGVDGSGTSLKTPPSTPKKMGKMLAVRVQLLDDSITVFQVQVKAVGRLLFDQVCKQLNLLEADYFGLEYQDATTKFWLDFEKPLHRQIGLSLVDPLLKFCVKFYTPYPAQLEEEYTRYLFCLQIKKDLMQGDLQCNDNTAALIISYIVQAECGDYSPEDYPDHTYLSSHKFVPHQDKELERKIMENHKKHTGQSPAEADLNLLETARRCELYGMKMHLAKDQEGVPLNLAVAHMGIVVFQNCTKINTFSWAKIRKISFKRKRFLIKLHPEGYGYYKDVVEFIFDNRNQCKSFWKKCVENHGFFRCSYVKCVPRQKARVLSRGSSSFRYSGKTQKQMVEYVRENYIKRQAFQRSQSFRHQSSIHSSVVNVGAGMSVHPLLPLGENAIAGSGASLSCGSMTISGSQSPTIPPDGGQQTAQVVMNQQYQQQQQQQYIQTDVQEPVTTASDITSIASQSPPHDTGLKHHYQSDFTLSRFPEMLTNTSSTIINTVDRYKNNIVKKESKEMRKIDYRNIQFEYDTGKVYTEVRFPVTQKNNLLHCNAAHNYSNLNDPDILKDLGKPARDDTGWQRSASCKELGTLQKQERLLKIDTLPETTKKESQNSLNKFDSYKYCYSCRDYNPSFNNFNRDRQHSVDTKVYSSSYPGTTPHSSMESDDEPVTGGSVFLMDTDDTNQYQKVSQDDLSHDSYEILEKENLALRSRSSSVNSDEIFVMENDYKRISKHILWREGSADVEKRLGYVEPRYRNINFNEFNEICKRGFASRNRSSSQSHGNIKFSEFGMKDGCGDVEKQLGHDTVGRTKSDPYMSSGCLKSSNRQKLFGLHQKSFDLPPTEYNDVIGDDKGFSKSTIDIPYTLRIRNAMNGTARDATSSCYNDIYENISSSLRSKSDDIGFTTDVKITSHVADYASQDSGLSLSLGMESVEDNDIDLKNMLLTKNYEQVVTTKKSTKLMLSLSEENNENVPNEESTKVNVENDSKCVKCDSPKKTNTRSIKQNANEDENIEKHVMKVKSMEVTKKTHSGRIRKSRSAETCDRKSSFLRTDSAGGSRGKKEIIVIDSDDYHSFDDSRSDKRSDGSDSVIIVEYRGNKKKKLSKKASSDSRGSQAESEASSFDAPRIKKKELKKRNSVQGYCYKNRIPTIEISEDETYKADTSTTGPGIASISQNEYEYSSDERGSDLSKTEVVNEVAEDECAYEYDHTQQTKLEINNEIDRNLKPLNEKVNSSTTCKNNNCIDIKILSTVTEDKKNENLLSTLNVDKSPLLTRLGLSEGSAISEIKQQNSSSLTVARRAKSLDTSIVSLHRLPPITSFSSKDDTVDNEEVVLEEKALKQIKNKIQSISSIQNTSENDEKSVEHYLNESQLEDISQSANVEQIKTKINKSEIKPKSHVNKLKNNSIAVFAFRKPSLDLPILKQNEINDAEAVMNKGRSKSEGYDKSHEQVKNSISYVEQKHSTRQERLDSFKKLKNFSIEVWESEDVDNNSRKIKQSISTEYDDNVFEDMKSPICTEIELSNGILPFIVNDGNVENVIQECTVSDEVSTTAMEKNYADKENDKNENEISQVVQKLTENSNRKSSLQSDSFDSGTSERFYDLETSSEQFNVISTAENNVILEKRSFDEEPSTSSSVKPEPAMVSNLLESSGSSSVEETVLPSDYIDDGKLSDYSPVSINLGNTLNFPAFSGSLSTSFNTGFFSLSRTLSRISERSTTSEQERTEADDDSTKPLSRSLSIDDSILSSDQHPSFSSDPPSGMNLENVFDEDDIAIVELDEDKLDFNIPPPLLSPDDDWPSPPCSGESLKTPLAEDVVTMAENTILVLEEQEEGSASEDNKTLHDDCEGMSDHESKNYVKEGPRGSIGDDTSAGITNSDWSSSTGTTIKQTHVAISCPSKSEDNSLNGEGGVLSLSTDMVSESRSKSSTDEVTPLSVENKYLTLDRKQSSADRKFVFFPQAFRSFDDEYDSPCTESEDTPSSPIPPICFRRQPPPPPRHFQDSSGLRTRVERNRSTKFLPQYTSSSMSTSLESPTSAERKFAKTVAKAKCYSYYSLARSPPSDGSSSSPDTPETPLTPNTIPRVSKRRRSAHPTRRKQHRSADSHKIDSYISRS